MAYMTEWYRLHHKIAIDLILIILRSNAIIKIAAGKIVQLSIASFEDVSLNTVLTFFYKQYFEADFFL